MSDAPERIWLQPDGRHWEVGEWTWCWHQIHDDDIHYIRADIADARVREARERLEAALLPFARLSDEQCFYIATRTVGLNEEAFRRARAALAKQETPNA